MRFLVELGSCLCALVIGVSGLASEFKDAPPRTAELTRLVKVPTRATILATKGDPFTVTSNWVKALLQAKEQRAVHELQALKQELLAEVLARQAAAADRRRRQEKYEQSFGGNLLSNDEAPPEATPIPRVAFEFRVPEIESYRTIVDVLGRQQKLLSNITTTLAELDTNADGKLSKDEYLAAAALVVSTKTLLAPSLDSNEDGYIDQQELEAAADLPADTQAAFNQGRDRVLASDFRLEAFDLNKNGVLDIPERKALTMAYVAATLRLTSENAFYQQVAATLAAARQAISGKFANIELAP